jgi:PAS domain S-box-containing protein
MMGWRGALTLEIRSLQTKFLIGTLLVLVLIMTGFITVVEQRQRSATVDEVQRRGEVLARSLAATSTGALLLYNFTALEQNVGQVAGESDVVYAIILDGDGKVVAHSRRPELVGSVLDGPMHELAAGTSQLLVQEAAQRKTGEPIYDIAMPVLVEGQKWGVARIGLSRRRMEAQIRRTRWELAALSVVTLVVGGLGAAFVARRIALPVRQLAAGAEAISRGELDQQIAPAGRDEIGQLALTFNHMAAQLRYHQTEIDAAQAELRRRFEQLAEHKNYTDSILGSVSSGIITLDLDGRVATMNPAAEMLSGLFAPDVTGRYCQEVFAHSPELSERLMDTLEQQSGTAYMSLTLHRPNGRTLPIEMSTAPLRGREGKDLGVVGVFRDVTVLRDLEEQLRRSDRLAALGTLAAGLAHEIKNPLTSLRTFTRFMPRKFDDPRFRERFQRVVPHELERIHAIVEQLLELARPARLVFQAVRLPELLDRTLDLYADQVEAKSIDVRREYARDCPTIQADPEYLYQALVNLVANALEAMSPGGRLTVRVGLSHRASGSRPSRPTSSGLHVKVEIEDTGKGISSSEADKVFNPFFTTKASGTGLGLALTHKIVEDHRGSITFRSVPGTGTTFRVLLPTALATDEPPAGTVDV